MRTRLRLVDPLALVLAVTPAFMVSTAHASTRVFVTSQVYNGNLGGLEGGDAKCNERADAASLGGEWVAWLSTGTVSAADRIAPLPGPFVRAAGFTAGTVIADDFADLTDGSLDEPIFAMETGGLTISAVWTGTEMQGVAALETCDSWTATVGQGRSGLSNAADASWTAAAVPTCNNLFALYCFEAPTQTPASSPWGLAILTVLMAAALTGAIYSARRGRATTGRIASAAKP